MADEDYGLTFVFPLYDPWGAGRALYAKAPDGYVIRASFPTLGGEPVFHKSPRRPGDGGDYREVAPPNDDWEYLIADDLDWYGLRNGS